MSDSWPRSKRRRKIIEVTLSDAARMALTRLGEIDIEGRNRSQIISRTNAPLMGYCLKLLRSGKRAAIKGRNVGDGIIRLIERAKAKSLEKLEAWLHAWHAKETARLVKRDRSTDEVDDRLACVLALIEDAETVAEVIANATKLFVADDATGDAGRITLGTTHKLKGLEADRVWMIEDTYNRKSVENSNCWYVACTRAKTDLRMVLSKKDKPATEKAS